MNANENGDLPRSDNMTSSEKRDDRAGDEQPQPAVDVDKSEVDVDETVVSEKSTKALVAHFERIRGRRPTALEIETQQMIERIHYEFRVMFKSRDCNTSKGKELGPINCPANVDATKLQWIPRSVTKPPMDDLYTVKYAERRDDDNDPERLESGGNVTKATPEQPVAGDGNTASSSSREAAKRTENDDSLVVFADVWEKNDTVNAVKGIPRVGHSNGEGNPEITVKNGVAHLKYDIDVEEYWEASV